MGKIGYFRLCRLLLAFIVILAFAPRFSQAAETTTPDSMTLPAAQTFTYNRQAAVTWAQQNNYNDGSFRGLSSGSNEGRDCTTYIGRSLSAGGLNTSTSWSANPQIVQWMLNNPNTWEFKPLDQLVAGDFILLSVFSDAPSRWSYIDPNGGWSLWHHVVMVIAPGRTAAWNNEWYDRPISYYVAGFPYYMGVHIRDSNPSDGNYQDQGSLTYGVTQHRTPNGSEHRWRLSASSSHAPILFDLARTGGDLTYRMILKNSSGQPLVDTRSSVDGRGIVTLENVPTGDYYLHVIPDAGKTGSYSITAWATSIPMIRYEWADQTSHSNVRRWQAPVGSSTQDFHVVFERTAGDLEINWQLKTRGGTLLNSGSSVNGRVIAPATASGWVDFYITSVTGDGSYRIGLRQGIPNPGVPSLLTPGLGGVVPHQFNVVIQPGPGNGRGTPDWHVQIDNDADFSSPVVDNGSAWSRNTTIPVTLSETGLYWIRVRQGDGMNRASAFSTPIQFTVQTPITLGLRAATVTSLVKVGATVIVEIILDEPQTAPGGGVYALENVCTVSPAGILDGQTVTAGMLFQPDPVTINQGFQPDDSHTYATSQSGSNPPISTGGVVYSLTFSAVGAGEATLDCDSQMIDANSVQGPLPFTGVKITVQQPPPDKGIVSGSVGRSHATDAGITVTLLDSNQNVVATTTTQNDGTFLISDVLAGTYVIRASTPGHLPAQGNVTVVAGQTAQMQPVVLPAGEIITAGNVIDELDVVQLAINYGKTVPPAEAAADFDLSGSIGLADLFALAQHLRMTGPISWGQ